MLTALEADESELVDGWAGVEDAAGVSEACEGVAIAAEWVTTLGLSPLSK